MTPHTEAQRALLYGNIEQNRNKPSPTRPLSSAQDQANGRARRALEFRRDANVKEVWQ